MPGIFFLLTCIDCERMKQCILLILHYQSFGDFRKLNRVTVALQQFLLFPGKSRDSEILGESVCN